MTPTELRRACELAELRVELVGGGPRATLIPFALVGNIRLRIDKPHPLLKPYVADLLVAKVREMPAHPDGYRARAMLFKELRILAMPYGTELATAEQRIRAACKALGVELEGKT